MIEFLLAAVTMFKVVHDTVVVKLPDSVGVLVHGPVTVAPPQERNVLWLVLPNLLLVAITAYYAWQTRRTVQEMRAARAAQVAPRLVPTIKMLGPTFVSFEVLNAGPGPAIDLECKLSLEPGGPEWRWKWPILSSGDHQGFTPNGKHPDGSDFHPELDQVLKHYKSFKLVSTCKDTLGQTHPHDDHADLADAILTLGAGVHWVRDPAERAFSEAQKLNREVEALRRAMERLVRLEEVDQDRGKEGFPTGGPTPS